MRFIRFAHEEIHANRLVSSSSWLSRTASACGLGNSRWYLEVADAEPTRALFLCLTSVVLLAGEPPSPNAVRGRCFGTAWVLRAGRAAMLTLDVLSSPNDPVVPPRPFVGERTRSAGADSD